MGVKTILFVLILVSVIAIVEGVPVPDYTLYGSVTVDGTKLTKDDMIFSRTLKKDCSNPTQTWLSPFQFYSKTARAALVRGCVWH